MKRTMLFWLGLALLAFAVPALAGDLILQTNGKWFPNQPEGGEPTSEDLEKSLVTVLQEDYDKTYYKFENVAGRQSMDSSKIDRVLYGSVPEQYSKAAAAMGGGGDLEEALKQFDGIAKNKRLPAWARMYSLYNMGRIYQEGLQDYSAAIQTWDRLQSEFRKSKFLPKSIVAKGLAHLALGHEDQARKAFQSLSRLPGLPEGKKRIAEYYLIKIDLMKGQKARDTGLIQQALAKFRALLKEVEGNDELTEVTILARLGIGDCLLSLEKYDEALAFFKKISDSSTDEDVLAGAFNGLGRCYYEKQDWNNALFSFLRTVILYDQNSEQAAMALYWAAKSYSLRKGKHWKERARSLYQECRAKYGNTEWARKAKEGLLEVH